MAYRDLDEIEEEFFQSVMEKEEYAQNEIFYVILYIFFIFHRIYVKRTQN